MATQTPDDEQGGHNHPRNGLGLWSMIRDFFGFKSGRETTSEKRGKENERQRPLSVHEPTLDTHLPDAAHDRHSNSDRHIPKSPTRDPQTSSPSLNLAGETNILAGKSDEGTHNRPSNYSSPNGGSFVDLLAPPQGPQPELTSRDHSDLVEALEYHSYIVGNPTDLSNEVTSVEKRPTFEGTYSTIYRGSYKGKVVAIKVIRAVKDTTSMRRKLYRDFWEWRNLDHVNVLHIYGVIHKREYSEIGGIISPWCENGDAERYLTKGVALSRRVAMFRDTASGLSYLHKFDPAIVHGDLRPSNVLIDSNHTAKICDFGLVRLIQEDQFTTGVATTTESAVTARYLAFELIEVDQPPTTATDVWALGCIGLEFIHKKPPYAHIQTSQTNAHYKICRDIAQRVPPATRPSGLNSTMSDLWDILEACWNTRPEERPVAENVFDFLEQSGKAIIESGIP